MFIRKDCGEENVRIAKHDEPQGSTDYAEQAAHPHRRDRYSLPLLASRRTWLLQQQLSRGPICKSSNSKRRCFGSRAAPQQRGPLVELVGAGEGLDLTMGGVGERKRQAGTIGNRALR
jgi:hypothetical protein